MFENARNAAFVAVDRKVVGGDALDGRRRPIAGLIARAGDFDLDDIGTVIGEHQRAVRTRKGARQIDDTNAVERARLTAGQPAVTDRQSNVDT
jgi:hypothetical protein